MFAKISHRIADTLEHNGTIQKADRELYEYGLRQMFITLLNILTMFLIGLSMSMLLPAAAFITAYIPLRVYAGGYHASTPQRCWAFSAVMLFGVLCVLKFTDAAYYGILTLISMFSVMLILVLSPVESHSKPLDENEKCVYHARAIMVLLTQICLAVLLWFLNLKNMTAVLEMVWCSLSLMLVLGKLKYSHVR